ncbi:DnaJ/Hsp40 cysteine-rich domain superfamily protein [Hibiscus syriacus]|uniref:DnaJ/Hsp40 cysteine-rich domain superfamily protein n=1 Tax=Hibiscus syriacus TaxID=106335 RepID=A0A6A3CU06_HIBSY|nr:VQ motif-containing protein 33-like [Hibiscus syriacus]KAE8732546.1 DnaJ/Hsp40 cysteine-rich domain superfamily protein [Hibiscus syriacus]
MEKPQNDTASPSPAATTFVQADANTFRDLVQKLTGFTNDTEKLPVTYPGSHPSKMSLHGESTAPRRPPFKLQERRQHAMRKLDIKLGLSTLRNSPNHYVSPSQSLRLDSTIPSPMTPLGSDSLFYSNSSGTLSPSSPSPMVSEEEKAIAEKGFYLHPSPLNTPRGSQPPELLTLFPVSSPSQEKRD